MWERLHGVKSKRPLNKKAPILRGFFIVYFYLRGVTKTLAYTSFPVGRFEEVA